MKKVVKFLGFVFFFSCICLFCGNKVNAQGEFWERVKTYEMLEEDEKDKYYSFDKVEENYNFKFLYDYMLEAGDSISDVGVPIYVFYGITKPTDIQFFDIEKRIVIDTIKDQFKIYKYDYLTQEYELIVEKEANSNGVYKLAEPGLYKFETFIKNTLSADEKKVIYVNYETELYQSRVINVEYNREKKSIVGEIHAKDPRILGTADLKEITISDVYEDELIDNVIAINGQGVTITQDETGLYKIVFEYKLTEADANKLPIAKKASLKILLADQIFVVSNALDYDMKAPVVLSGFEYHNKELYESGFNIMTEFPEWHGQLNLSNSGLIVMQTYDDSEIVEVKINDNICEITKLDNNENYMALCSLEGLIDGHMSISVKDDYENVANISAGSVIFDNKVVDAGERLEQKIALTEIGVQTDLLEDDNSLRTVCAIYGRDFNGAKYECIKSDSNLIELKNYFKGDLSVIIIDTALNFTTYIFENIEFTNGYRYGDFEQTLISDWEKVYATVELDLLKVAACNDDEKCLEEAKMFVKYGEIIEELIAEEGTEDYFLPSYLEILNKKFRDSSCASTQCNKQVDLVLEYKLGQLEQNLTFTYNFEDTLPRMLNAYTYEKEVALEYKDFDIEAQGVKNKLFANSLHLILTDDSDATYDSVVSSAFIEYVDREGNVTPIDNEDYTYIAKAENFGYYLLECRIQLLDRRMNGNIVHEYSEPTYTKSFFVRVELRDTIAPTLTLNGEKTLSVKQNDVYKDPGATCEDKSACTINVTYYFNSEDNPVESIDTKVPGEYIIKYIGTDGDGNESFAVERRVTVIALDQFDKNTIIVVSTIVAAFILCAAIAILVEVRKSKKRKMNG